MTMEKFRQKEREIDNIWDDWTKFIEAAGVILRIFSNCTKSGEFHWGIFGRGSSR